MVLCMPVLSSTSTLLVIYSDFLNKVLRKQWRLQMCPNKKNAGDSFCNNWKQGSSSLPSLKEFRNLGRFAFQYCFFFFFLYCSVQGSSCRKPEACTERKLKPQRPHQDHWQKKMISWGHNIKMEWKWVRKHYVEKAAIMRQFTYV